MIKKLTVILFLTFPATAQAVSTDKISIAKLLSANIFQRFVSRANEFYSSDIFSDSFYAVGMTVMLISAVVLIGIAIYFLIDLLKTSFWGTRK